MAKDTQLAVTAINAEADALARLLDNGYLRIYDGEKPADGNTALSGNTLMSEHRFSATSAPNAANGVLNFNPLTSPTALSGGTPIWFRALKSDGTTNVLDGTCGAAGSTSNLEFSALPFVLGGVITIASFTHTIPAATAGA